MNSVCASVDYSSVGHINVPINVRVPDLNDDLQRIADENNVSVSASIAFIRTISTDIVREYRQRLVQQPTFRDKWITLPVIFPSANSEARTFRVLASIFENVIAGELSPCETGPNDEELDNITSTEPHIYDYVDVNTAANKTKVTLRVNLISIGVVAFCIIAIVTVVLLVSILSPTSNTTMTTTVITIPNTTTITTIPTTMTDCYDWLKINESTSNGIYQIDPGYGLEPFDVYCDMITDGGGWTVIQRRVDGSLEFYNNTWNDYKLGFNNGLESGNLWLGNDRIHVMSSRSNVILRVEIYGDRYPNNTNSNLYLYSTYNFSISDETNDYTLTISQPIDGNASKPNEIGGFHWNNGYPFSTVDKASNKHGIECANGYQFGGWWFYQCVGIALNGKYNPSNESYGIRWYSQATCYILPIRSEMKIRRIE